MLHATVSSVIPSCYPFAFPDIHVRFLSLHWTLTAASFSLSDMPGSEGSQHFFLIQDTSACSMGCLLKARKRQLILERDTLGTIVTIHT